MGKNLNLTFSFIFIIFIVFVNGQQECETLSSDFVSYSELKDCLLAQPYNQTIRDLTLTTLNSIIDSYVFVDISKNSPNPNIPMQVDIQSILTQISKTNYTSDSDLQQAFASAFINFQDAHTRYTKPLVPYVHASFVLPIKIQSSYSNSQQTLQLTFDTNLLSIYNSIYNSSLTNAYEGYSILLIDNQDSLTAIGSFANSSVGYSKDYSSRFNLAVDGYGLDFPAMFTSRNQSLQGVPTSETVSFTLQNPNDSSTVTLQLNWIGNYLRNVSSSLYRELKEQSKVGVHEIEFLSKYRRALHSHPSPHSHSQPSPLINDQQNIEQKTKQHNKRSFDDQIDLQDVYYEMLADKQTAILRVLTFAPSNITSFINTIENAFLYFKTKNAKQLIIDLSQNGGGDICLGYALSRYIFPDVEPYVGCYDLKASNLFQLFANSGSDILHSNLTSSQVCGINPGVVGYFTPCAWYDWDTNDLYSDNSWITPGLEYNRGGVISPYSNRITQGCQVAYSFWLQTEERQFSAENIILLSDGLCGSTCAVFARHFQLNHLAKTVVTGGVINSQQPSFTSFPGGEVVHLDYILDLATKYQVESSIYVPPPLPTTADFRFAIREIYGWEGLSLSSLPQEFTYLPADFQMSYESGYLDHQTIWEQTISYFDICASWESKPCSIANGTGAFPCVDGSFNTNDCQVISCYPGHERKNGQCTQCALGFYKSGFDAGECSPCFPIPTNCKYISQVNTSPMCDYTCSACSVAPPAPPPATSDSGIVMPIWLIVLISVSCFIFGIIGGLAGSYILTSSYLQRKKHFYSHISDQD